MVVAVESTARQSELAKELMFQAESARDEVHLRPRPAMLFPAGPSVFSKPLIAIATGPMGSRKLNCFITVRVPYAYVGVTVDVTSTSFTKT